MSAHCFFDGAGWRYLRIAYDGQALIAEYNASNALLHRYVHGPGTDEPIVWYEGTGTSDRRWLHADERGSIIAITNASGTLLSTNRYDEYGIPASTNAGRFQYTGQTWLPELGMFYYKARIYSPTLGRFMQTDPIGYAAGLNWYAYVGNDPVNGRDPSGMAELRVCTEDGWLNGAEGADGEDKCISPRENPGITVIGSWKGVTYVANPIDWIDRLIGYAGRGYGSSSNSSNTPQKDKVDPCDAATRNPGRIEITYKEINLMALIGITVAQGTWKNLSTGDTGRFVSPGFAAGTLDVSVGAGVGVYRSLAHFRGHADNYTGSRSFRGFADATTTSSFGLDGSYLGQSAGASFGPSLPKVPSFGGSMTETIIYGCKLGG